MDGNKRTYTFIMKILAEMNAPLGAARVARELSVRGINLSPRTVRFYLLKLDQSGMTRLVSRRRGRELTELGRDELANTNIVEKIGFVSARVDDLVYGMSFDVETGAGSIIANVTFIPERDLERSINCMEPVFRLGLGMGSSLIVAHAGESLAGQVVPRGMVAFGTVCSVTLNGVMLSHGIPVVSRYGGLIEVDKKMIPTRFVELVEYKGTTCDPLELFINAGLTRVNDFEKTGSMVLGASFREVPTAAIPEVRRLHSLMEEKGLGSIVKIGMPNQPLLEIPVADGRTAIIVLGGLNPIAALCESGVEVEMDSLSGFEDILRFAHFKESIRLGRRQSPLID